MRTHAKYDSFAEEEDSSYDGSGNDKKPAAKKAPPVKKKSSNKAFVLDDSDSSDGIGDLDGESSNEEETSTNESKFYITVTSKPWQKPMITIAKKRKK